MTTTTRTNLYDAVLKSYDLLHDLGVSFPDAMKQRDPREPGRVVKTRMEARLQRIIERYFRRVKKKVRVVLQDNVPEKGILDAAKMVTPYLMGLDDALFDEFLEQELIKWNMTAVAYGLDIFQVENQLTEAILNMGAFDFARLHAGELITQLTNTQRNQIGNAVGRYVTTRGMTIGDLIEEIAPIGDGEGGVFGLMRARRVAVSEVTNTFAAAQEIAGKQLQNDNPGVLVVKTWQTNNDGLVCPVCAPLNQQRVPFDDKFVNTSMGIEIDRPPGHPANCRCWMTVRRRIGGVVGGGE